MKGIYLRGSVEVVVFLRDCFQKKGSLDEDLRKYFREEVTEGQYPKIIKNC